ncbi:hypothetical protein [Streptomyces sp. Isolate_45]|uniref:hypothetical protein n=1 Tax=Streptomyces sp. Isolate_45 TaxID=2950111 RepID=UPI002481AB50|nr:hypothetical protein [Streptomyces sp. Isolate_45]MDA5280914.1 hypothetical protein [Streptomyces sp. Isolate_45]
MSGEVPEKLYERGLFEFDDGAIRLIRATYRELDPGSSPTALEHSRAITFLDAAEFSLMSDLIQPESRELPPSGHRIQVDAGMARLALLKAGCCPLDGCLRYFGPNSADDFTVFSGDSIKLRRIKTLVPPGDPTRLWDAVQQLRHIYRNSPSRVAQSITNGEAYQLQGLLWHLKISFMEDGFQYDSLEAAMFDAWRYFAQRY